MLGIMRTINAGTKAMVIAIATFVFANAWSQPSFVKIPENKVVCYGSDVVNIIYIPPPAACIQTKGLVLMNLKV